MCFIIIDQCICFMRSIFCICNCKLNNITTQKMASIAANRYSRRLNVFSVWISWKKSNPERVPVFTDISSEYNS